MKICGLFFTLVLLVFGFTNPKTKPQPPNVNWTSFDEPPLYSECPQEDVTLNWACFAKSLQKRLDKKLATESKVLMSTADTLFITLKVDTIGKVSIVDYSQMKSAHMSSELVAALTTVIDALPLFQPAFKTNLEVPVEAQWTLPVAIHR